MRLIEEVVCQESGWMTRGVVGQRLVMMVGDVSWPFHWLLIAGTSDEHNVSHSPLQCEGVCGVEPPGDR